MWDLEDYTLLGVMTGSLSTTGFSWSIIWIMARSGRQFSSTQSSTAGYPFSLTPWWGYTRLYGNTPSRLSTHGTHTSQGCGLLRSTEPPLIHLNPQLLIGEGSERKSCPWSRGSWLQWFQSTRCLCSLDRPHSLYTQWFLVGMKICYVNDRACLFDNK